MIRSCYHVEFFTCHHDTFDLNLLLTGLPCDMHKNKITNRTVINCLINTVICLLLLLFLASSFCSVWTFPTAKFQHIMWSRFYYVKHYSGKSSIWYRFRRKEIRNICWLFQLLFYFMEIILLSNLICSLPSMQHSGRLGNDLGL